MKNDRESHDMSQGLDPRWNTVLTLKIGLPTVPTRSLGTGGGYEIQVKLHANTHIVF